MKRFLTVRARPGLSKIRRPGNRGYIAQAPVRVDTHEGFDFYAKLGAPILDRWGLCRLEREGIARVAGMLRPVDDPDLLPPDS